jgi:hypothetical protein
MLKLMEWLKMLPHGGDRACRKEVLEGAMMSGYPQDYPLEPMLDHLGRAA